MRNSVSFEATSFIPSSLASLLLSFSWIPASLSVASYSSSDSFRSSSISSINELVTYEDLGFSPRGKAIDDINSGFFEFSGGLPVNTDGGLKCFGHPIGATGLRMIYEVYKQLQGKAGARQLKKVRRGLTHNIGGAPGAFISAVSVFGLEE